MTLDNALAHYAQVIARDLDIDVINLAGGGAAGGMGAALYAFCGAQLRQGIEIVTDALHLAEQVANADLVITGKAALTARRSTAKCRWASRRWLNALINRSSVLRVA